MQKCKGKHLRFLFVSIIYLALSLTSSFAQTDRENSLSDNHLTNHDGTISINVKDIEIADFFSALARRRKVNIIPSKDVSGTISVNLHNIPLAKAIEAVSEANGYQCIKKNDIYYIVEEETRDKKKTGIDTTVKSFHVNFANMSEVRKVLEDIVGEDNVAVHQEAKTVIVEDSMENIRKVESILRSIDYAPRQVLIEAKILEIALGDSLSFGVDWQKTFEAGNYAGAMSTKSFALPENTEGAQGFFLDVFKNNQKLKANLDMLESRSDLNVLATPKIMAVDGKAAEIIIGGRLGYYVVTSTETSTLQSVEFLDTGTQLKITPHISEEGKILMDIHPEVSDGTIDALGLPSTRTTEVTTFVLAEHGDTIFIGGLIRQAKEKNRKKIPVLGNIPLIGSFFGRTEDKEAKSEIIILITPYIVSPDEKMIYEAKNTIVERAETSLKDKRTTVEKLFHHEKMFEKIQGKDKDNIHIQKREKSSAPSTNNKTAQQFEPAGQYSLLVSSFYEAENAEAFTEKLQQKGYPAYVLATKDKSGNPLRAVKIGPLNSQESAQDYTRRLKTEEGISALTIEE